MIFCEKSTTFYGTLAIVCIINDFLWKIIILNDYVPNKSYKDLFNHLTKKESSLQLQVIINIKKTDNINSVQSSRTSHPLWVTLYISFSAKDSFHFDADPDLDPGHKHFFKNYWFLKQKKNVQILKKSLIFMFKLDESFRYKKSLNSSNLDFKINICYQFLVHILRIWILGSA